MPLFLQTYLKLQYVQRYNSESYLHSSEHLRYISLGFKIPILICAFERALVHCGVAFNSIFWLRPARRHNVSVP